MKTLNQEQISKLREQIADNLTAHMDDLPENWDNYSNQWKCGYNQARNKIVAALDQMKLVSAIKEACAMKDAKINELSLTKGELFPLVAELQEAAKDWKARAEQAEAQCEVMREALEWYATVCDCPDKRITIDGSIAKQALSTTCGKELLEEVKALRADKERNLNHITRALGNLEAWFESNHPHPSDIEQAIKSLRTAID